MSTVAGTDWTFPTGQTRATEAPLGRIFNFCIDREDNLYIPDTDNHLVLKVTPSGILTVVAGNGLPGYSGDGGPALEASLLYPRGCGVDSAGNVYIADTDNNRVRKVDFADGTIRTVAGNGEEGFSGDGPSATTVRLFSPRDIVFDSADNMYVADTRNHRIRRVTPSGAIAAIAGTGRQAFSGDGRPATEADLNTPDGIFLDSTGILYIADTFNHCIRRVAADGTISTVLGPEIASGSERLSFPKDIVAGSGGVLYIVDPGNNVIRRMAANGVVSVFAGNRQRTFSGDGGPAATATLGNPVGILLDRLGNLLIADTENLRVRRVSGTGIISTIAGNGNYRIAPDGSAAVRSYLSIPHSIAVGSDGTIYIADYQNHRVVRVTRDGAMTTVAGTGRFGYSGDGGPANRAAIYAPKGVALDRGGNLYIADTLNSVIRKINPDGIISTFAGTGRAGFSGEGVPATTATLNYPTGVATDADGNVYITDSINHAVRMVNTRGIITTIAGTGTAGFSGDGGSAKTAQLNTPYRVALDTAGNIYVTDIYNHRIRRINSAGIIETIAGTGQTMPGGEGVQATQTATYTPTAVAVDSAGNIYYTEQLTSLVRRISTSGVVNTIGGNGRSGFSGDGRIATEASMYWPLDLAIDSQGNLYVADSNNHRIRRLLVTAPEVTVPTQTLLFSAESGGARTAAQPVDIIGAIPGIPYQVKTSSTDGGAWLRVGQETGGLPATLEVSVDPTELASGTYSGSILVETPSGTPRTSLITVRVDVSEGRPPQLSLESDRLTFAYAGTNEAVTQQVAIRNAGGQSLDFQVHVDGASWLTVEPSSGSATPNTPARISVTANPKAFPPGTYDGSIVVTHGEQRERIGATMTITGAQPKLTLSQAGLTFRVVENGGQPLPQTIGIVNSGQGQMRWNAVSSTLSGGQAWLSIGQTTGTLLTPLTDVALVEARVDPTGMAPGDYYGRIDVTAADNTKQTVSVLVNVLPAGSRLPPEVRPNGLIFTGAQGEKPGSQSLFIANRNTEAVTFASNRLTLADQPWFVHVPATGTLNPNQPLRLVVQPDFSNLPAGVHQGSISVLFADGTIENIPILSVIADSEAAASKGTLAASGCTPTFLKMVLSGGKTSWTIPAGQPATLEAQVIDSCGQPLTNSNRSAVVKATFVNDNSIDMRHIGQGKWSATYQPRSMSINQIRGYVTAFVALPNQRVLADQVEVSVNVQAGAAVPLIARGEVRNAASFQRNTPLAPGSLVTIFGLNLSTGDGRTASDIPLPREIAGTEVRLGDRPLPLLYVGENQINAQVPYDVPLNTQHHLIVRRENALSVPDEFTVAPVHPAVFAINQQGYGQGAIVNARTNVLADGTNPVSKGDIVSIYCTGLGVVDPAVPEGNVAPSAPLSRTTEMPVVTIGGVAAQVSFAGLSPGSAGLYQVNVTIPDDVPVGDTVPVVVTMGGIASNTTTISIR